MGPRATTSDNNNNAKVRVSYYEYDCDCDCDCDWECECECECDCEFDCVFRLVYGGCYSTSSREQHTNPTDSSEDAS
ncbi:hypothetical protein AWZ03_013536 [Drosophila navojoa]|uniref:Uncharacterized protein n=1 Tax=Drosophila navojoa TaxID=7232 RepID=A0A484AUG4_DRONA|nr:hypothetical protein AWZ03_013536 [Drosophila navojoa]